MGRDGFITARVPAALVQRVDTLVDLGLSGITSRNAFIAEAVRKHTESEERRIMQWTGFLDWMDREAEAAGEGVVSRPWPRRRRAAPGTPAQQ
jgi:hypothetical protein